MCLFSSRKAAPSWQPEQTHIFCYNFLLAYCFNQDISCNKSMVINLINYGVVIYERVYPWSILTACTLSADVWVFLALSFVLQLMGLGYVSAIFFILWFCENYYIIDMGNEEFLFVWGLKLNYHIDSQFIKRLKIIYIYIYI